MRAACGRRHRRGGAGAPATQYHHPATHADMLELVWPPLAAFLLAVVLTYLVRPVALMAGVVAVPKEDRWHRGRIPLLGGVAIVGAVLIGRGAAAAAPGPGVDPARRRGRAGGGRPGRRPAAAASAGQVPAPAGDHVGAGRRRPAADQDRLFGRSTRSSPWSGWSASAMPSTCSTTWTAWPPASASSPRPSAATSSWWTATWQGAVAGRRAGRGAGRLPALQLSAGLGLHGRHRQSLHRPDGRRAQRDGRLCPTAAAPSRSCCCRCCSCSCRSSTRRS